MALKSERVPRQAPTRPAYSIGHGLMRIIKPSVKRLAELQTSANRSDAVQRVRLTQRKADHFVGQRRANPGGVVQREPQIYGSEQLHQAILQRGDDKANAQNAVTDYFEQNMLSISNVKAVYASSYDYKTGDVGAEFHLKAGDGRVAEIASNWVFHTHAKSPDRETFTLKRDFNANHIKPASDPYGKVSLSFASPAAFDAVESSSAIQTGFSKALLRAIKKSGIDPHTKKKVKKKNKN